MRGVSKPEPPNEVHPDGQVQESLPEAEAEYLAALQSAPNPASFARSEYRELHKPKLRAVMYREQGSLCIYCERRVAEGYPPPRIDHWYPLSRNHQLALHWNNLYLSCLKAETCETAKSDDPFRCDNDNVRLPWPVEFQYEDVVGFNTRGEIYVRSDVTLPEGIRRALDLAIADRTDDGQARRSILNLNDPSLVKARVAAVRGERKRMKKRVESGKTRGDEREKRATRLLGRAKLPQFVSIRVAWLRKRLGKGR